MGFNSGFKGLKQAIHWLQFAVVVIIIIIIATRK